MSGERLYSVLKTIAKKSLPEEDQANLIYGVVKSINPLKIEIENKFTINEEQINLSAFCKRKTLRLSIPPHTHSTMDGTTGTGGAIDNEVELWRGLQINDVVILLRHSKGQAFYVMQRVGELV